MPKSREIGIRIYVMQMHKAWTCLKIIKILIIVLRRRWFPRFTFLLPLGVLRFWCDVDRSVDSTSSIDEIDTFPLFYSSTASRNLQPLVRCAIFYGLTLWKTSGAKRTPNISRTTLSGDVHIFTGRHFNQ